VSTNLKNKYVDVLFSFLISCILEQSPMFQILLGQESSAMNNVYSNQLNYYFPLSQIHYHNLRQRKIKIKLVWKFSNQRKIWTSTFAWLVSPLMLKINFHYFHCRLNNFIYLPLLGLFFVGIASSSNYGRIWISKEKSFRGTIGGVILLTIIVNKMIIYALFQLTVSEFFYVETKL